MSKKQVKTAEIELDLGIQLTVHYTETLRRPAVVKTSIQGKKVEVVRDRNFYELLDEAIAATAEAAEEIELVKQLNKGNE